MSPYEPGDTAYAPCAFCQGRPVVLVHRTVNQDVLGGRPAALVETLDVWHCRACGRKYEAGSFDPG